jgi:alkylated DNA repair dioxygenase AlkB
MSTDQLSLFGIRPDLPEGMIYREEFLSSDQERALIGKIETLPFAPFEFHGFEGKRRTVSFGWRYRFDGSGFGPAGPIPSFLMPLRKAAAEFAGIEEQALEHTLVTEYAPGAGIGWHKDRSVFADTIGISLGSPCRLRFRRPDGDGWERLSLSAEPRSIYLLRGPARSEWEHSIVPVGELRYSVTFRSLAARS